MNKVECVIKRGVRPREIHLCSKNIGAISLYVLKISVVYKKKEISRGCYCTDFRLNERFKKKEH